VSLCGLEINSQFLAYVDSSAAIPFLRRIKHAYELEINHFLRGNAHSSPLAEEDIANLQEAYRRDAIHVHNHGRKLNKNDKPKDYIAIGSDSVKLSSAITSWWSKRDTDVTTEQIWEME